MKITTKLTDRYTDPWDSCESYSEYAVLADGKATGYEVIRVGTDTAELRHPDGETEYLSDSDLRSALPEAKRLMATRLA